MIVMICRMLVLVLFCGIFDPKVTFFCVSQVLSVFCIPRSQISGQQQPVIANHAINLQTQQANNNQLMLMQMQMQMQNQMNTMNVNSQQNSARKLPMSVSSARDLTGQGFPVMT